jgi:Cellulose-binding Sde182, nucleoside hydrolase-like domain/Cellulose-binding protein Sde0182, C-terminal domain
VGEVELAANLLMHRAIKVSDTSRDRIWCRLLLVVLVLFAAQSGRGQEQLQTIPHVKPRLIVLTDLSNEPDDEESFVRLLVYSDQFDIEGLIATTSTWLRQNPREDLIRRDLAAYALVRTNLLKHSAAFPSVEHLLAVTRTGQTNYGMAAVGTGKTTGGSQRIIEVVDRADDRPIWVSVWGGPNTLAQALWDVRASLSPAAVNRFVAKLRVYAISDQDDSGAWIRREFTNLFYIVTPSNPASYQDYYRATWTGISGGRGDQAAPGYHFEMVDNPWLEMNIIKNHGPLGTLYPRLQYIMEGDTPSFLGLIDHGLGWEINPAYGGWGGRYMLHQPAGETRPIWTDTVSTRDRVEVEKDRTETSNQATIWRWRKQFQNDFAARMDWCVTDDFKKANHNPRPVLNSNRSTDVLMIPAKAGATVKLSAEGTGAGDDGQNVKVTWWIYREAGTLEGATLTQTNGLTTTVLLPRANRAGTVHVILQAEDDGVPHLCAYRRIVISTTP